MKHRQRQNRKQTILNLALGFVVILLGGYILLNDKSQMVQQFAGEIYLPGIVYMTKSSEEKDWKETFLGKLFPLYEYANIYAPTTTDVEDAMTYELILAEQANDEYSMSEDLVSEEKETAEAAGETTVSADLSIDKLRDFNYLLSKFYTVDSTTSITQEQLNVDDLLSRDMHIDRSTGGPKILIFHTHSQEAFVDSVNGDASTSIVGMGVYLAELLNMKGIETIHHAGVYDLIDGQLDRSKAYQLSEEGVKEILNQYPSIEVVIDLHRDGVPDTTHLVTEIDGKQTAKIMFFNGLSRTKAQGDIAYLYNPYIQDNLSFSFQMQMASESIYPGFARRIYLKGYRYSLHMMPKSLLIEAGAQTNTVEEMKNSMELLANILVEVLL